MKFKMVENVKMQDLMRLSTQKMDSNGSTRKLAHSRQLAKTNHSITYSNVLKAL